MALDINPIIKKTIDSIRMHSLGEPGAYCRYVYNGIPVDNILNEYGCADAANIKYTINYVESEKERIAALRVLKSLQDRETGLFNEGSHVIEHCTAHCLGALELFDAHPDYPIKGFFHYAQEENVVPWLESLEFSAGRAGHHGAGVFSSLFHTRMLTPEWQSLFFDWLDAHCDPDTGINTKGDVEKGIVPMWHLMGDWFHLLFCYHSVHREFPFAERTVDSCIKLYKEKLMPEQHFGRGNRFLDIDWAFCLYRSAVQTNYKLGEARELLYDFAEGYVKYLTDSDMNNPEWSDMHLMFGMICGLSELYIALPGAFKSDWPLRQILDRRPFI